jgi:signal peptidase I
MVPEETPVDDRAVSDVDPDTEVDAANAPSRRQKHRRRVVTEWLIIVVVALAASFVMRTFVVQTFYIPSGSMEPTLLVGDRILVSKLSVSLGTINRGDIVVFKAPPAEHCGEVVTDLVKRVIGLPGDYLTSKGNTIYVGTSPTTEVALSEPWTHTEPLGTPIGSEHVPANTYFVMGDNHADSCDSRMWGTVPKSDIIGKVFLRIWPLSRVGFL